MFAPPCFRAHVIIDMTQGRALFHYRLNTGDSLFDHVSKRLGLALGPFTARFDAAN